MNNLIHLIIIHSSDHSLMGWGRGLACTAVSSRAWRYNCVWCDLNNSITVINERSVVNRSKLYVFRKKLNVWMLYNTVTFTISHVSCQAPKDVQMDQKDGHVDPKRWAGVFITEIKKYIYLYNFGSSCKKRWNGN